MAQKIDMKLTLFLKMLLFRRGVAMSELSNGTKKHTSKSYETIPLMPEPALASYM
jgi:hypothetical protein